MSACSGYRPGELMCSHGFVQSGGCRPVACHGCGRHSDDPRLQPWCLREEHPPHLAELMLDDTGRPKPRP